MREARLPRTGDHAPQPHDEIGGGSRALNFWQRHRNKQFSRVGEAMYAMKAARKAWAIKRTDRWVRKHGLASLDDTAPSHIKAMAHEGFGS